MEDASPVDVGDCHCELREPRENLPLVKVRLGLARVADLAEELLGDAERAKKWLKTPHRYLGGETPIAALETEIGADLVVESLYAIAYGGVA